MDKYRIVLVQVFLDVPIKKKKVVPDIHQLWEFPLVPE